MMSKHSRGKLIIIGGKEDRENEQVILNYVLRLLQDNGRLLLITVATQEPEETAKEYRKVFKKLGHEIEWLNLETREDGLKRENIDKVKEAGLVFFTGGDQLRITSQMGDTPIYSTLHERFHKGMHVVGTSAGAAVLPETMLTHGDDDESNHADRLRMAPGLGLIEGVVIDSHFAQRGRMGRLLGAVAQNPANIGIGIDENTAIIIGRDKLARVIGEGAVYIVDGSDISYSSLSEDEPDATVSIYNVRMHVLAEGRKFDLRERQPILEEDAETEASA